MNILRKLILFGWMAIACTAFGKDRNADKVERPNTKKVNFGIKAGFNSSMFMVSELKIKDVTIDEVQNNYKIGYFGALFMRINMKKHFIQPEVSYNVSKCEITFDKLGSQHPAIEPDYASVQSVLHSVDFPILYGYSDRCRRQHLPYLFRFPLRARHRKYLQVHHLRQYQFRRQHGREQHYFPSSRQRVKFFAWLHPLRIKYH